MKEIQSANNQLTEEMAQKMGEYSRYMVYLKDMGKAIETVTAYIEIDEKQKRTSVQVIGNFSKYGGEKIRKHFSFPTTSGILTSSLRGIADICGVEVK